jgi:hypothetical protein
MHYYPHSGHNLIGIGSLIPKLESPQDIDLENESEILGWFQRATVSLSEYYASWFSMCQENVSVYTSLSPYDQYVSWAGDIPIAINKERNSKTNYIAPIVETHISRLTSTRARISVLPVHSSEYSDKAAAKTSEQVIKTIFHDRHIEPLLERVVRHTLVCGSGYLLIKWDPEIGPPSLSQDDGVERSGDVNYKFLNYTEIMQEPVPLDKMDWFIEIERINTERLKEKYPDKENELQSDTWNPFLQGDDMTVVGYNHDKATTVLKLYHRSTNKLQDGLLISATKNTILEVGNLPYPSLNAARKLPICRFDDIIPPGMSLPIPLTILEAAKGPQAQINQLNKTINRNITVSAPKWVVKRGSVTLEHLNNAAAVLQYRGDREPKLTTASTVPRELFDYRNILVNDIHRNTGAFKQSFGEAAPNTRAGVMLEFHEEQEFKRAEPLIKRYNDFIENIADITLKIASDYYLENDERKVKILADKTGGPFKRFKIADLQGSFDILIERTSALPDSKEGKLRWIVQLSQLFPDKFDWEQVKKSLDFASDKDLKTSETEAYELQMLENEVLIQGMPAQAPMEYQDHISHLHALYPLMDSVEFAETPDAIKKNTLNHARAHEMLAWKKAITNPAYAAKLMVMPEFPKVFVTLPSIMPISAINPVPAPEMESKYSQPVPTEIKPQEKTDVREPSDV